MLVLNMAEPEAGFPADTAPHGPDLWQTDALSPFHSP